MAYRFWIAHCNLNPILIVEVDFTSIFKAFAVVWVHFNS